MNIVELKQGVKAMLRGVSTAAAPLFSKKSTLSPDAARACLQACAPCPSGTSLAGNVLLPPRCDLQIIIPAYNVEAYLEQCMDSVLTQQTRYSYHVVLVDDGAKDRTPELCDRYAGHPQVTVIHQRNRGLSGARNRGLTELFGRYILFIDSDDFLLPGAIDALLDTAFRHGADLVEGGAAYVYEKSRETYHCAAAETAVENPYSLHGHAWGKVYKAELFERLCFPEGFWYEDSLLSYLIFPAVKDAWLCPQVCYGYRINESGIVKASVGKPRAVETYWITERLLEEHVGAGLPLDEPFREYLLLQARLNQLRVEHLPEEVQESVFVLTCQLLDRYFPDGLSLPGQKNLQKALRERDFGSFKMCCRFF